MADNKQQHYVPKATLRHFACDPDRQPKPRLINLINISRGKVVRGASLADQCYRDYFYGKDTRVEKALGGAEGYFASLVRKMITTRSIDERDGWHLVQMVSLQRGRTLRAEQELNGMTDKMIKLFMFNKIGEDDLRRVRIGLEGAARLNVAQSLAISPMLLDLKRFLIVNETSVPFVIADNPVVSTNWFGRKNDPRRMVGIARSGLQMILPLTPKFALMMHDNNVYNAESDHNVIALANSAEASALNELQWMNAYQNVYSPPTLEHERVEALLRIPRPEGSLYEFKRLERLADDGKFQATDKDEFSPPSEGVKSELVVHSARALPRDARLRAVRLRDKAVVFDDGSMASPQRDPVWEDKRSHRSCRR
ncbi:DUF4238 domain-containing protein [Bosea sp. 685]|uniref:DUF4238 domain-containing protein n=1 Tax=Bosea sp. 685 TaxID=3080057 RepID=UPI00289370AE|nr:DUF4238 domain-containing protein [Bosea sp. 685]WNJ87943.1 DUF4238 domain-containing protein [Bosea sp. 685]